MYRSNVYRENRVHVCAERCDTCIFHPGNRMNLEAGRVAEMVRACRAEAGGNIPCHERMDTGADAICRGFWDAHHEDDGLLVLAERLGTVEYVGGHDVEK